jgi:hypothetical protein
VGVGGVGGRLLVAEVDDGDVVVQAAVVNGRDVAAAEGVDGADALGRQRAGDEFAAVGELTRHRKCSLGVIPGQVGLRLA